MKYCGIGLIIGLFMVMSCATSQFGWTPDPALEGEVQVPMNEDFDFVELDNEDPVIAADESVSRKSSAVKTPVFQTPLSKPSVDTGSMVLGHRVQLSSFEDENYAREAKKNALFQFQEPVYLIFDSGLWKLRVGDCTTVDEAKALVEQAVQKGYRDAYKVVSKVHPKSP